MAEHNIDQYHNAARNDYRKAEYRKDLSNNAKLALVRFDSNFAALAADNKAAAADIAAAHIPAVDNKEPALAADFVRDLA